jgi:hypothetical protein
MTAVRTGVGIPRLQELEFVGLAVDGVVEGRTYDEIRASLFNHMTYTRRRNAPSGNHAGTRMAQDPLTRYVHNATEALTEAMRLGFVERAQLPSSKKAAAAYANLTFVATPSGREWATKQADDAPAAYTELLGRLWDLHPQFRGFLGLLQRGPVVIPSTSWREVHGRPIHAGHEEAARAQYVDFLAARCSRAIAAGGTGWQATEQQVRDALREYIDARVAFATRRARPHPYPRHGDFVSACEEAVVSFAFTAAGMPLDYISLEILRRWTRTLGVANFSYYVPDAPALRLWATAEVEPPPTLRVQRRSAAQFRDAVLTALPDAYERARRRAQGASFVPVHLVRAGVCFRLGLNDGVFDSAVRDMLSGEGPTDLGYRVNLDRAQYGAIPPTEQPIRVPDRSGREQTYTVMTLVNRPERTSV